MTSVRTRARRILAACASTSCLVLVGSLSAGPAEAETITYSPHQQASNNGVDASLLDPGTIGLCNAGFGDVSVASWETGIGHVDLFCGDDRSGYVHIRTEHQVDWQTVVDGAGGGANWDDFMVFATGSIVTSPGPGFPEDEGDGKLCYSAPILIKDEDGNVVDTYNPTVIVSANNKKIITSFPTHLVDNCG
ncbi:hypothetical protein QF007_001572 [Clavibacter michiganensis]|nr:hypothetical protein [Clavibacter michiganensis]